MTAARGRADWSDVRDEWPERSAAVAALIPPGASVLDLGSGAQGLARRLDPSCRYTPADLVARTPDTLRFDMAAGIWPVGRWDVVVMAGVLEYAPDAADAFRRLEQLAPVAIVTYLHRRNGSLGRPQLKAAARRAGWSIGLAGAWALAPLGPVNPIYRLIRRARARGNG